MNIFKKYEVKSRDKILGQWLIVTGAVAPLLIIAFIVTIFIQFRRKLFQLFEKIYAGSCDEFGRDDYIGPSILSLQIFPIIFCVSFLFFLVASSKFRKFVAELFFPFCLVVSGSLAYYSISAKGIKIQNAPEIAFSIALFVISFFFIAFEIALKDRKLAIKNRWISFGHFLKWQQKTAMAEWPVVVVSGPFLFAYKLILIDCYGLDCPDCERPYFAKTILSFNPMAQKCEHCGLEAQKWIDGKLEESRMLNIQKGSLH